MADSGGTVNRKTFRVGYFVMVDVEAHDAWDAAVAGEAACGWPGTWSPPREAVEVEGEINGQKITARIVRSQMLMVESHPGRADD